MNISRKTLTTILFILLISGCVSSYKMSHADLLNNIEKSPIVTVYNQEAISNPPPSNYRYQIDVYYKSWNPLSVPSNIANWQFHFKIAESSEPYYSYKTIASVSHYIYMRQSSISQDKLIRNDQKALDIMKEEARKLGGLAIINTYREPIIDSMSLPAMIKGYHYRADIIK